MKAILGPPAKVLNNISVHFRGNPMNVIDQWVQHISTDIKNKKYKLFDKSPKGGKVFNLRPKKEREKQLT